MRIIPRLTVLVLIAVLTASLVGCNSRDVAADVNGEDIYVDDIEAELEAIKAEYPQMFQGADANAREMDFKRRILDNLVVDLLQRQAAEESGIDIDESDIDAQLEEIKAGFPDDASYQASLDQVGMTEEDLRGQIESQLLTQQIIEQVSDDIEIAEEDVEAYYEANQEQFRQTAAKRAAHILFDADDRETAEQVLQQVRDGGDFEALARQYSTDPGSAEQGGDLGWPSTPYVAEFQEALDGLEVGEVSDLVESVFGWHIITVLEEREETMKSLEDAREEIVLILEQQRQADAYQEYIEELRAEAEIEYFVDYAPGGGSEDGSEETTGSE
jgi:foldase protein PrsA